MIDQLKEAKKFLTLKQTQRKRKRMGEKEYNASRFLHYQGYELNLDSPRTFNEKIQWLKIYGDLEELTNYVDKYAVRQYIKGKIGEKYQIPLIGVYERSSDIDFDSLPTSFVIKATHSSGWNLIVKDKNTINWKEVKKQIDKWIKSSFYQITGERNYKNIKGRVVIEEIIGNPSVGLKDYKIFCFDGEPKFIEVDEGSFETHRRDVYDVEWKKIDVVYEFPQFENLVTRPSSLEEMLNIAKELASDFKFVRVDLYYIENKIYFGELSFTPGQGFEKFSDKKIDSQFGDLLILNGTSNLVD